MDLHQLAPRHEVEELLAAADLDVGAQRHGVVGLHQGVEELVHENGVAGVESLAEGLARKELLDGEMGGQLEDLVELER